MENLQNKANRRMVRTSLVRAFIFTACFTSGLLSGLSLEAQPLAPCTTVLESLGAWNLRRGAPKTPPSIDQIENTLKEIVTKTFGGDPYRMNTSTLLRARFLGPQGITLMGQTIMLQYWRAVVVLKNPDMAGSSLMDIRTSMDLPLSESESLDYFRAKFWPAKAKPQ